MRKLDRYILKKYIVTFIFTLLILIPVAIAIDVSEKIGKFLANTDLGLMEIDAIGTLYFYNFIYF
jgi:lipopolysaccharide export system permease protein